MTKIYINLESGENEWHMNRRDLRMVDDVLSTPRRKFVKLLKFWSLMHDIFTLVKISRHVDYIVNS